MDILQNHMSRCAAGLFVSAFVLMTMRYAIAAPPETGNGQVQIAALSGQGATTGGARLLLDPDPLVVRAQELLTRLGRYAGPVDGRFNQQLAEALAGITGVSAASQDRLEPDPLLTRDVVDRLALMVDVDLMQERLAGATERQREQARQALEGSKDTRDFLERAVTAPVTANRDADGCFADPGARCLLTEALAAADVVLDRKQRDWAYSEILVAQANAGYLANALATAQQLSDPRAVLVGMRRIAGALVRAVPGPLAAETATAIPDPRQQSAAFLDIAEVHLQDGRLPEARQAALAAGTGGQSDLQISSDDMLRSAAVWLKLGNEAQFTGMLDHYRSRLPAEASARKAAELALVERLASLDRLPEAEQAFAPFAARNEDQVSARIALALALARSGEGDRALVMLGGVRQLRYKAVGLARLAILLRHERERAIAVADLSMMVAGRIELSYARSYAYGRLVDVWMALEDMPAAERALDEIEDDRLKAVAALRLLSTGEYRDAATDQRDLATVARRSIDGVADRLARVWLLCSLEAEFGGQPDSRSSGIAYRAEAIDIARSIRDPWFRARAWARISESYSQQTSVVETSR
ncbi:hypothetical protein GH722_18055 [Alphaproteobacteria bacterium HT1-32]|nr:hypothetical protein [Alphaproteobacteria bacterium HT1-32]